MPTPAPALDRTMNVWGDLKSNPDLLQRTIDLLNNSPTAREQIREMNSRIGPNGDVRPIGTLPGNGAQYNNTRNQIEIGIGISRPEELAGTLAHELGHYIDDVNLDRADEWGCNPSYIGARVMTSIASEGIGAINNFRIFDEIFKSTEKKIDFIGTSEQFEAAKQAAAGFDFRTSADIENGYSQDDVAREHIGVMIGGYASSADPEKSYWDYYFDAYRFDPPSPSPAIARNYNLAITWQYIRDPFTLDLDGGGISTSGSTDSSIVFDYDGDGIRTGTGWIRAGEAFLVADRNADGVIDTGAELFGVDTLLPSGLLAKDGFSAIAPLDTNADGKIDITDTPVSAWQIAFDVNGDGIIATGETRALQFTDLMVWQDINQNGVSEASELRTLTEAGIASISTAKTVVNTNLGNGNRITGTGVFTRADGSAGGTANLDLAELRFFREYVNPPEAPASANDLPDMEGSGSVARLRVAAATDAVLNPTLRGYAAGTTRAAQRANLDALIGAWADTSAMRGSREAASDLAPAVVVQWQFAGVATYSVLDVLRLYGEGQTAPGSFQMAPAFFALNKNQTAG